MSTRAQVRFATREEGITFNEHPEKINAQFYVHSDGYPEGLGLQIADSIENYCKVNNWEIESLDAKHGDLEYIYYIWQTPGKTTWISIFEVSTNAHFCGECGHYLKPVFNTDKCIFVGEPQKLIEKYKQNTNDDG
jgi:hypothetical protein